MKTKFRSLRKRAPSVHGIPAVHALAGKHHALVGQEQVVHQRRKVVRERREVVREVVQQIRSSQRSDHPLLLSPVPSWGASAYPKLPAVAVPVACVWFPKSHSLPYCQPSGLPGERVGAGFLFSNRTSPFLLDWLCTVPLWTLLWWRFRVEKMESPKANTPFEKEFCSKTSVVPLESLNGQYV